MADKGKYSDKGKYLDVSASGASGGGSGVSIADESSYLYFPSGFAYNTGATSLQLSPAGRVFVYRNYIPFEFKTDAFHFRVVTAGAGSTIYGGIYNNAGSSLLLSGSNSGAAAADVTISLGTDVTLPGGYYLIAFAAETSSALPYLSAHSQVSTQVSAAMNNSCASGFIGYGSNTTSAALPATVGTITTSTSQRMPFMVLSGSA